MITSFYRSPIGYIRLNEEKGKLTGLSFSGGSIFQAPKKSSLLEYTCRWLDGYFSGSREPFDFSLISPCGTDFQKEIWRLLLGIPYGKTSSYGDLARLYSERSGISTSPRAVGGAVGKNPIAIIIPCHRVVCSDGSPGGFAYGLETKLALLEIENR